MVRIVQCLCGPLRHAITAVAYDDTGRPGDSEPPERILENMMLASIATGAIDPFCAICGSQAWVYEDSVTVYATMDEARPHLETLEAENAAARAALGMRGRNN